MAIETVTVLFTDLVGSTELLSRVGEGEADRLRREHFGLLRRAIDDAAGREVKNLGDGLMAVFGGAGAALACAVAMQQAMSARVDREPLAIRIGVAIGEAEAEDGDYFGLPVIEAARLCATAAGGEILATAFVRMLVRSRGSFEMDPLGALELKGLEEPVEAFRVRWEPRSAEAGGLLVPVPPRVVSLGTGVFAGRHVESRALDDAFKAASEIDRRGVFLAGEPGIGKTTLAARASLAAAERGAAVLYGRCDDALHVPFQPWVEALGHLVTHCSDELVAEHITECGPVLGRIIPQVWRRSASQVADIGPGDDESDRHLLLAAVTDLLARSSEITPVVLVLDDLHWADDGTLLLLRHLLTSGTPMRLLVISTFRDTEVSADHPLAEVLSRLHRERGVERFSLRGLNDDELLEALEVIAGHELADDGVALRDALLTETAGNPFFVTELLRHLADTGGIHQAPDGRWHLDLDLETNGLPVSIREVVGRRVAALGPEIERVLTLASVIGGEFELSLLERVVDLEADHLVDLCDTAVQAAVLHDTEIVDRYTFAHALIERSLYDSLSTSRRARSHRLVAEALEELCGDHPDDRASELARHWTHATRPGEVAKAIEYARLAGDRALAGLAPAEAQRWYTEAFELLDEAEQQTRRGIQIRLGIGEAQRLRNDPAHRDTLLQAARDARAIGADDLLIRAALANNRGTVSNFGRLDEDRITVLREALERVGADDTAERARLLGMLAAELTSAVEATQERETLAAEAVNVARGLENPRVFIEVVVLCDRARATPEHLDQRQRDGRDALTLAETSADPTLACLAHLVVAGGALDRANRDGLELHVAAALPTAEHIGYGPHVVFAYLHEACRCALDGDPDALDAVGTRLLEVGVETGVDDVAVLWTALLIQSAKMRGTLADLIPGIERAIIDNPGLPILKSSLAWAYAHHDVERARPMIDEARRDGFEAPYDPRWMSTNAAWAEAVYRLDDAEGARMLLPRFEPWPDQLINIRTTIRGVGAHFTGLMRAVLGEFDRSLGDLEHALAMYDILRAPYLTAATQVAVAETLIRRSARDDSRRARVFADQALAASVAHGYGYVESDARAVLARLGD